MIIQPLQDCWTHRSIWLKAFLAPCEDSELGIAAEMLLAIYAYASGAKSCKIS